jgi:uncharacterized RDD family membrane protein YckC
MEINSPAVPAPLGVRVLAAILDSALVFLVVFLIIWQWGTETAEGERSLTGIPELLLMLGIAAFWILPEWLSGSTIGKWACDLRVTTLRGSDISFSQSLKRNVLRMVDFMPLYLPGFVAASLTPKRQRLGDLWAKTIVISTKTKKR